MIGAHLEPAALVELVPRGRGGSIGWGGDRRRAGASPIKVRGERSPKAIITPSAFPPVPPSSPGEGLLRLWRRYRALPGGRWLFGRVIKWMIPYTGSVSPR